MKDWPAGRLTEALRRRRGRRAVRAGGTEARDIVAAARARRAPVAKLLKIKMKLRFACGVTLTGVQTAAGLCRTGAGYRTFASSVAKALLGS